MTGADLRAWRESMGYSQQRASEALGLALRTVQRYEADDLPLSRHMALACGYLALAGLVSRWIEGAKHDAGA